MPMLEKQINGYLLEVHRTGTDKFVFRVLKDGKLVAAPVEIRGFFWRRPERFPRVLKALEPAFGPDAHLHLSTLSTLEFENALQEMESTLAAERNSSVGSVDNEGDYIRAMITHNVSTKRVFVSVHGQNNDIFYTIYTNPEIVDNDLKWQPYLVMSDRQVIPLVPEILLHRQIFFEAIPSFPLERWSLESIQRFISGQRKLEDYNDLFRRVAALYDTYMDFYEGPAVSKVLALWVIGTYFHPLFAAFPYVYLNGTKASGKTKTMMLTEQLALNPVHSVNMSMSSLFRLVQAMSATVLVDESEDLKDKEKREGYRELLNAGYKRSASTYRTEERKSDDVKSFHVTRFRLYSPKMIANITGIEDVLESRCISMIMKPTTNPEKGNKEPDPELRIWQETRDCLYEFFLTAALPIKATYESLQNDGGFKNREWELWKPILALAHYFDKDCLYPEILAFAKKKVEEARMEDISENAEYVLMKILQDRVESDDYYDVKQIADWFATELGYDAYSAQRPKWLNSRYISNVLKTLGFRDKRRMAAGVEVRIRRSAVIDQSLRMGLDLKERDKEDWVLKHITPIVPISVIGLELEFLRQFGDTDENTDLFWQAIRKLREQNVIAQMPDDKVILRPLEASA